MIANELRIGNFLNVRNGDHFEKTIVDSILPDDKVFVTINKMDHVKRSLNEKIDIQPIPLTEEWLLKFGFEKNVEGGVANSWHYGTNSITRDWMIEVVQIIEENRFFYRNARFKLQYVHQLQNLYFALTGEELTIKEPAVCKQ